MNINVLINIVKLLLAFIWSESILMLIGFFGMTCFTQVTLLRKYRKEHTNKAVGEKTKMARHVFSAFFSLIAIKFFKISYFEELTNTEFFIQISVFGFIAYMLMYLLAFISVINDDKIDAHLKEPTRHDAMDMHCIYLYLHEYQFNYIIENAVKKGISNTEVIKDILRNQIKKEYK